MTRLSAFFIALVLVPTSLFAKRKHEAHDHGVVNLDLVPEGSTLTVVFKSPADSIVGFEYEAKTPAKKKQQDDALAKLKNEMATILGLPEALGCKAESAEAVVKAAESDHDHEHGHEKKASKDHGKKAHAHDEHDDHESHSNVEASFKFSCAKPLSGTQLSLDFSKHFPKVRKVLLQVVGVKQDGAALERFPATIKL